MNCPFCKKSLEEHAAGRCLDAWVGEVSLGHDVYWDNRAGNSRLLVEESGQAVPSYSEDMNAAMELYPDLDGKSFFGYALVGTAPNEYGVYKLITNLDNSSHLLMKDVGIRAETPDLAICKAYLKMKMESR